jgi:hypothetical protein
LITSEISLAKGVSFTSSILPLLIFITILSPSFTSISNVKSQAASLFQRKSIPVSVIVILPING